MQEPVSKRLTDNQKPKKLYIQITKLKQSVTESVGTDTNKGNTSLRAFPAKNRRRFVTKKRKIWQQMPPDTANFGGKNTSYVH